MSELIILDEVTSTNDYLRENASKLPSGSAVTALVQTAGRGRRGHLWNSDGGALPLSILLKNPPEPSVVPLCAGVAVCGAISALSDNCPFVGIKWPNDIIIDSRKVCGILCESARIGDDLCVICGIGVNISQERDLFEKAGLPDAGSLRTLIGITPERNALARDIVRRLLDIKSFSEVYEEYKGRCVNIGREVRLIYNKEERTAFAEDITESGALLCRDKSGHFEVNSGEVSVRGLFGYI